MPRAGDEQLDRVRLGEGLDRVLDLAADTEAFPARREDREVRTRLDEARECRRRLDHLLEVVEDQEHLALADVLGESIRGPERLPDLGRHERRVADRCELDPERPGLVVADELGRRLDREPGLAGTAGAREREEAGTVADQRDDLRGLPFAPDERARRPRQVRVRDRLQWRESLGAELEDGDRLLEVLQAVLAEVDQRVVEEAGSRAGRLAQQDLPAVSGRTDPGTQVDVVADVTLGSEVRRSRVHPDTDLDRARPQRLSALVGRGDRLPGVGERVEERVALGVDLDASVAAIGLAEEPPMLGQRLGVSLGARARAAASSTPRCR